MVTEDNEEINEKKDDNAVNYINENELHDSESAACGKTMMVGNQGATMPCVQFNAT